MAAEWYYIASGQRTGPVELQALREMLGANTLSSADLVYGPGLANWTPAGQTAALAGGVGNVPAPGAGAPAGDGAAMLGYRGVETIATGLSDVALRILRETKPWARFMAVITFIAAGFMAIAGLGIFAVGALGRPSIGIPPAVGFVYVAMGALYIVPGIFLNRYASGIAKLLLSQQMVDVEYALRAQKSFWKFVGIMMLIVICIYAVIFIVFVAIKARF